MRVHRSARRAQLFGIVVGRVISARAEQLLPFYLRLGYRETGTRPFPADLASKVPAHYILMSKPLA